jgi:Fe-S-cluster containining protein
MKLGVFEDMYLRVDEDGDKVFQSMPCPFLGDDNLCTIYDDQKHAVNFRTQTAKKSIKLIT